MWWQHRRTKSNQTTNNFIIASDPRFFRRPTPLTQSPMLLRIIRISKAGFMSAAIGALGAVRAYAIKQKALIPIAAAQPQEMQDYQALYNDIRRILETKEREHLVQRGYPRQKPTNDSQHFEQFYSPEKLHQIVLTHGKEGLKQRLKRDYFSLLDYEEKRLAQLQDERENLAKAEAQLKKQEQPQSWWQGFMRKSAQPEQSAIRAQIIQNQEQINSSKRNIQEKTPQLQMLNTRIDTLD